MKPCVSSELLPASCARGCACCSLMWMFGLGCAAGCRSLKLFRCLDVDRCQVWHLKVFFLDASAPGASFNALTMNLNLRFASEHHSVKRVGKSECAT